MEHDPIDQNHLALVLVEILMTEVKEYYLKSDLWNLLSAYAVRNFA